MDTKMKTSEKRFESPRESLQQETLSNSGIRLITKIKDFSNRLSDTESKIKYRDLVLDTYSYKYEFEVNIDERNNENVRYISVKTHKPKEGSVFRGTCFISVIDASGIPKFEQSFTSYKKLTESPPEYNELSCINYIKRETLLADPTNLLPKDTLTLQIDFYPLISSVENQIYEETDFSALTCCKISDYEHIWSVLSSSLVKERLDGTDDDMFAYYLNLDSELAKVLCSESYYFQRILDTPMLERRTRRMSITEMEYDTFLHIAELLLNAVSLKIASVEKLYEMYILSDKYDIPFVTETCLCFFKHCLSDHNHEELLEKTFKYKNEALTDCIAKLLKQKTEVDKRSDSLKERVANFNWIYKSITHSDFEGRYLLFEKRLKTAELDVYY